MLNFSERLREERVRLGFNQADFAALGGVAKTSQFNYEKGERSPDAAYLVAIGAIGVDVLYVLTGTRIPTAADALSKDEDVLLANYRQLDEKGRATVQDVAHAMARAATLGQ